MLLQEPYTYTYDAWSLHLQRSRSSMSGQTSVQKHLNRSQFARVAVRLLPASAQSDAGFGFIAAPRATLILARVYDNWKLRAMAALLLCARAHLMLLHVREPSAGKETIPELGSRSTISIWQIWQVSQSWRTCVRAPRSSGRLLVEVT